MFISFISLILMVDNIFRNWSVRKFRDCFKAGCMNVSQKISNTKHFSERELMFMFAICRRPSVCRLSVTFVHPTQPIEIFGNVSTPCNTLVT